MLMMFHFYFMGNPEGLVFDVVNEPFSAAIWQPLRGLLERQGGEFRLDMAARQLGRAGAGWRVLLEDQTTVGADGVVLALDVPGLQAMVAQSPDLDCPTWRLQVEGLGVTLPFAVWRVFLDRPVHPDRSPFVGTTGLGFVDNISIYECFEGESRRWAQRHGGSVVEVHAYAVDEGATEAEIRADFEQQLHSLYPETRDARPIHQLFLLRRDCPSFAPGTYQERTTVATPIPGLALAGDFVRLPFPSALMERAVASGFAAANHLLGHWQVRPEPLWSVPRRGLLARFRRLWSSSRNTGSAASGRPLDG